MNGFLAKAQQKKENKSILFLNNSENCEISSGEELFLKSSDSHHEFFDFISTEGDTFIAAIPLSFPRVQVLGVQTGENKKEIISYQVQPGDSLTSIAQNFDISLDTILWANNLSKNSKLKEKQELIILPISGVYHIVKSGETIGSLAKKYQAEKDEIISFNETEQIIVGDILIIPNGKMPQNQTVTTTISSGSSSQQQISTGFIVPIKGYISQGLHWYNAVDIANSCGTPVYAAASGVIQQTGYGGITGNYVRISHPNGTVTFYGHLSKILVSTGQNVSQGSVIGNVGNTGYTIGATGCHLHFEVRGGTNPFANYKVGYRF